MSCYMEALGRDRPQPEKQRKPESPVLFNAKCTSCMYRSLKILLENTVEVEKYNTRQRVNYIG